MIVVHMFRIGVAADRADPALPGQQLVELSLPDAGTPAQVVLTAATVRPLPAGSPGTT
ncbi:hypothetical protein ABTX15_22755 [Micromonospora sp. NPDC094482]|uniref:hypothetical protein n=1 Tax=Micromonospora sp. NPDC094482 TaxID=3155081 RepID=UPI00331DA2AD